MRQKLFVLNFEAAVYNSSYAEHVFIVENVCFNAASEKKKKKKKPFVCPADLLCTKRVTD